MKKFVIAAVAAVGITLFAFGGAAEAGHYPPQGYGVNRPLNKYQYQAPYGVYGAGVYVPGVAVPGVAVPGVVVPPRVRAPYRSPARHRHHGKVNRGYPNRYPQHYPGRTGFSITTPGFGLYIK